MPEPVSLLSNLARLAHAQATAGHAGHSRALHAKCTVLLWACLLLAVLAAADAQLAGPNTTAPNDVAALTAFRAGLSPQQDSILSTWVSTDPCQDGWKGVICSCEDLPIRSLAAACVSTHNSSTAQLHRVLGLDLGPMANIGGQKLQGTISPMLGNLRELLFVDLSNNEFTGTLPDQLSTLTKLQWLLLDNNQLSGSLPRYLGAMPHLKQAQLQNNNFSGEVPGPATPTASDQGWCSNQAVYDVSFNPLLCGTVPGCLQPNRVNDIEGTFLSMGTTDLAGQCDATPPDCNSEVGCVIWTPMFWTSRSMVSFNFTGFVDYETNIARTQWGIGSKPFVVDVVPLVDVTAAKVLKDIKYAGGTQKMFVTPVVYNLTTISLLEGHTYYVTVVAWNNAGPPLSINVSSKAVLVDTTGPVAGEVHNTFTFQQAASTTLTQSLQTSWNDFGDTESGVTGYVVQFFAQTRNPLDGSISLTPLTDPVAAKPDTRQMQIKAPVPLAVGTEYVAKVTATNAAGLSVTAQSMAVTIVPTGEGFVSARHAALIGGMCGVGCLIIGAMAAVYVMRQRVRQHRRLEKQQAEDGRQLKALMFALSASSDPTNISSGSLAPLQHMLHRMGDGCDCDLAFVWTDIEGSTELSQQDGKAFKQLQEIHDQLMREGIAKHGGYEIATEGDSFQVAFASCQAAMSFCTSMQYRLLEQSWPRRVISLGGCKAVRDYDSQQLMFAGPRVRMGVHFAQRGSFAMKVHNLTRHKVFAGPAIQIVADISDIAHGGQIVLTEDALNKLLEDMSQAGFPVVHVLGLYQTSVLSTPTFLYSVSDVVGKPLKRTFPPLRKCKQIWPAPNKTMPPMQEYNVCKAPKAINDQLVFVAMRLSTRSKNEKGNVPPKVADHFTELFCQTAQQFRGYVFETYTAGFGQGVWAAVFQDSMDALRFTHAAQMLLMYINWPRDTAPFLGSDVPSLDGRWLFKGPRVAMAIHHTNDYRYLEDKEEEGASTSARRTVRYDGSGVMLPVIIGYAARGGQVVLSEPAWESVKDAVTQHPGAVSTLSLGMHILSYDFPKAMHLMEVMPNLLSRRNFAHIQTKRQLDPGYRDAPDPSKPMAIVFMKVNKPDHIAELEKGEQELTPAEAEAAGHLIAAYQYSVTQYAAVARRLLRRYEGYECKEPEPGKFTIAFSELESAIQWACHVQEELLFVDWPQLLSQLPECAREDDESGNRIWNGPRVRIGMSWGMITNKRPLGTGRADYFGVLANCAARVMALAAPGQVLIEAAQPPQGGDGQLLLQQNATTSTQLLYTPGSTHHCKREPLLQDAHDALEQTATEEKDEPPKEHKDVFIHAIGFFLLRGLDQPKLLFTAETERLRSRLLAPCAEKVANATVTIPALSGGSFASSHSGLLNGLRMLSKRSNSPTALRAHSPSAGIARVASGDSMLGPAPRSRSSLSAGGQLVGLHGSSYGGNSKGVMSEAGRAGMGFGGRSVGGVQGSPGAPSGFCSAFFGRSSSPPQDLRSFNSETAGRGFMYSRPPQQLGTFGAAIPAVIINAAVSEDESGGTPAAGKRAAAQLESSTSAPALEQDGPGVRFASVPNMRPCDGTFDPLLGRLPLPRIHTGLTADSLGRLSDGSPVLGGTCPLAVVQSGPSGSPSFHTSTSCTGTLTALEQQPHQQLQQQQRRQSANLLLADGTSACAVCPPSVDPAAMPECLQPWQEQNEPWHERQQVLLADGGVGVGSVEVGIYRQGSTTPVSLSTTMTSCMDDEYGQGAHGVQQQEAQYRHMMSDRAETSMSFSGIAGGMRGVLAGVSKGKRAGGTAGGASKQLGWRQLLPKFGLRRHSTSSGLPTSGGMAPGRGSGRPGSGCVADDEGSEDDEGLRAVQQQHGMLPRGSSPHSTPSHTPGSSVAGSRGGTGGGADLMSPGKLWAQDVAQTYVSARQSSGTSLQPSYGSHGGLDSSLGGVHAGSFSHMPYANSSNADGSIGGGSMSRGSFSRGGSYAYAEPSYSPLHGSSAGPVSAAAVWQQYGHQEQLLQDSSIQRSQQQQQGLPSRPSGMQLSYELSLRAPGGGATAATAAAAVEAADADAAAAAIVNPADVLPELMQQGQPGLQSQASDVTLQPQGADPNQQGYLAYSANRQDRTCQRLSAAMWESVEGSLSTQSGALQQPPLASTQCQTGEGPSSPRQQEQQVARRSLESNAAAQKQATAHRAASAPMQQQAPQSQQQGNQVHQSSSAQASGALQRHAPQQQQHQQVLHAAQPASRPSPLGKNAAKGSTQSGPNTANRPTAAGLAGQQAVSSSFGQAASTVAGSQRQQGQQYQQAAGSAAAPVFSSVAVDAKRALGRGGLDISAPGGSSSSRGGAAAATAAAMTQPGSPSARQAAAQGGSSWAMGGTQDPPPGGSRLSSGGSSPRYPSASSNLQGLPSGAASLPSLVGSSAPGSPRGSLPTTLPLFVGSSAPGSPNGSLPTTPRSRGALGGAAFGSAASGAPGSAVGAGVASSPFLQRTASNSSCGSPRMGSGNHALQQAWGGSGRLPSVVG